MGMKEKNDLLYKCFAATKDRPVVTNTIELGERITSYAKSRENLLVRMGDVVCVASKREDGVSTLESFGVLSALLANQALRFTYFERIESENIVSTFQIPFNFPNRDSWKPGWSEGVSLLDASSAVVATVWEAQNPPYTRPNPDQHIAPLKDVFMNDELVKFWETTIAKWILA